jgi:hypothetical protein
MESVFVKTPILISLAVLLISGCDKPEVKRGGVSAAPKPEERLNPTASPPAPEAPPAKPVASPQELEAFYAEVAAFEKEAAPLLKKTDLESDAPEVAAIQAACDKLLQKRVQLTSGMLLVQKKEVAKKSIVLSQVRSALMELQLQKALSPAEQKAVPADPAPPSADGTSPKEEVPAVPKGGTSGPP